MAVLVFDTETTGKVDFGLAPEHPSQPRVCQLAALLCDDDGSPLGRLACLVRPAGWTIPGEAQAVHGLSTEHCARYGLDLGLALVLLNDLVRVADVIVAHNLEYDDAVLAGECRRLGWDGFAPRKARYCTMRAGTDLCKIPGKYGFKWPRLQELHRHLFGEDFAGAHDAMADVAACARCYFQMFKGAPAPSPAEGMLL